MRKIYAILPLACALTFTACDDYDDTALWEQVNSNTERIAALEEWQETTNNNIAALQQLLNTNDMITSVTPVLQGDKEVGYTITFLHSDPVTIYHGEKGDKGEDGTAGSTPQIGLTQQTDGNWYWTLNGELMTDSKGNPIRANGEDGKDGQDGEDGADGDDGSTGATGRPGTPAPTPQIKLGSTLTSGTYYGLDGNKQTEADKTAWYLSVDNGASWYRVNGKDGQSGSSGAAGDSFFKDVVQNDLYVTFTLTDGTTFQVPVYQSLKIGDGTGTLALTETTTEITLTYPDGDYTALVAQITPEGADGTYTDISTTRADNANGWKVEGDLENAKVTVTAGSGKALLRVTLIRNNGDEVTASRIVEKPSYTVSEDGTSYTVYNTEGFLAWAKAVKEQKERAENADPTRPIPKEEDLDCVLAADVDLQGIAWEVLAPDVNYPYGGTLDGAGHTISNLTVNVSDGKASFIGNGTGCTIKNLTLVNPNITNTVGGLGAFLQTMNTQAVLENCHVVGGKLSATGNNGTNVGGLVGEVYSGSTIRACSSSTEVSGKNYVGGIAGIVYNNYEDVQIIACYATGTLTAKSTSIGGLVGKVNKSVTNLFTSCYYQVKDVQYGYYFNNTGGNDGTTSVGNDTSAWQTAAENMNAALSGQDYQWMVNEGEDKDDRPLIIQAAQ